MKRFGFSKHMQMLHFKLALARSHPAACAGCACLARFRTKLIILTRTMLPMRLKFLGSFGFAGATFGVGATCGRDGGKWDRNEPGSAAAAEGGALHTCNTHDNTQEDIQSIDIRHAAHAQRSVCACD